MPQADDPPLPKLDTTLLLGHLEYAVWATRKTLAIVDRLPAEAVEASVVSSFPSILETLRHCFAADRYYFSLMKGDRSKNTGEPPKDYAELKREWTTLHDDMLSWASAHLTERKDVVLDGWGRWPTWMALMQVVSHGTHHLGQVVTLARQAGYRPSPNDFTDLIFFYLERFPQPDQVAWREVFGITEKT